MDSESTYQEALTLTHVQAARDSRNDTFWPSRTARVRITDSDQSQKTKIMYGCSRSSGHAVPATSGLESQFSQLAGLEVRASGVGP